MNPFILRTVQSITGLASQISPDFCAQLAFKKWFKTYRHNPPKREVAWIAIAKNINVPCQQGKLNVLVWPADGPKVLLVHGWNGRGSQMGAFAEPLNKAGFEVIAVDLPGHGASFGSTSSLPLSAQALSDIEKHFGAIHTLVGHSFGGAVCLLAAAEGLQVQALVTIGTPSKISWLLDLYVEYLNFSAAAKDKLAKLLEDKFGADIWNRCDVEFMSLDLSARGLVVHDEGDKDVPMNHAETIVNASSARLLKTQKLGHFRILRNNEVIKEVVDFIATRT